MKNKKKSITYRFENFGGIISSQDPPFLAFVDRQYMREQGLVPKKGTPEKKGIPDVWNTQNQEVGLLSAPTEVHFAITNRCSLQCDHCYMGSGKPDEGELDTRSFKDALDVLARMKVFHIALGGGEAMERSDLFEIAAYAREKGIVPNLTVSGLHINETFMNNSGAEKLRVFGQINISMDGVGETYATFRTSSRGRPGFADRAVDLLTAAGIPTGINCVVGRENFPLLENLFKYAAQKKLNEIEFLRFKPSGRGKELYFKCRTTDEQNRQLIPRLARWSRKYKVTGKIDCSFVPMYCYHKPPPELLESMATYGCEAGNVLLGVRSNGKVAGCSFLDTTPVSIFDLEEKFKPSGREFDYMRHWETRAQEPCRSCDYLHICKGGCHAVSQFVEGDYQKPDPDCPIVVDYKRSQQ